MRQPRRRKGSVRGLVVCSLIALSTAFVSCSRTAYYERECLADRAMEFDADPAITYLRNKIEAAREGAFGGFGGSAAGGCGCQ